MESTLSQALRYVDSLDIDQDVKDKLKGYFDDVDCLAFTTGRGNMIDELKDMLNDHSLSYRRYHKETK